MKKNLTPVIRAMLEDEEFLGGGIFTKEKYYADKYGLTTEEIINMQICLYYALHIDVKDYNDRVRKMVDYAVG